MGKVIGFLAMFVSVLVFGFIYSVLCIMLQGRVLSDLWVWFIQPEFGISLGYVTACGIMVISKLLAFTTINKRGFEESKIKYIIWMYLHPILTPFSLWVLGAIIKFLIF